MRCPICKKSVTAEDNPFRPFCSERCKLIDLDNWLAERYRIRAPAGDRDPDESQDKSASPPEEERD